MSMSATVPLSLLEDIFRLLDYLDKRDDHDEELHFQSAGYSLRFEHDNALWELWMKIKQLQGRVLETYLLTIGDITEDEKHDLLQWVAAGNSVYDNPYLIYDDSGRLVDFINGCRIGIEMAEDPSCFFVSEPDGDGDREDDLPF